MKKELKLTRSELFQLHWYALSAEQDGSYYGNKDHYDKRHEKIIKWLQQELKIQPTEKP
jgi:hypothetical protein